MIPRRWLWLPTVLIGILQCLLMIRWVGQWGFFGGILHWFDTFRDPISAAAGIDLMALMVMTFTWMRWREGHWSKTLGIVLLPFIVFPSLGLLLYLIISEKTAVGENSLRP